MEKIGRRDAAGLSTGHALKDQSSDKALFGAIRDEMDTIKNIAITSDDANDLPTVITLANEMKVALNALGNLAKKFEK